MATVTDASSDVHFDRWCAACPGEPGIYPPDDDPPPVESHPSEPTLPFAEWIRLAASVIRFQGNGASASEWLARKIDLIATEAESLQARTPAEFDARHEVMEHDHCEELWAAGKSAGYDACIKAHFLESCYQ